jgi:transcriptional regulator GlxA family with amidase domain
MAPIDVLRRAVIDLRGLLERPAQADREAKVARAMQLVKLNLGDKVRLRDIAREVGFAPGYLSKLFHQRAGEGLRDYRKRLRVERAKTLLRTTDVPIGRIASAAGFISRANFFAAFRKLAGTSPGAYRARRK